MFEPLKQKLVIDDIKHKNAMDRLNSLVGKRDTTGLFPTALPKSNNEGLKRKLFGVNTKKELRDKYMDTLVNNLRREIDGETVEDLSSILPDQNSTNLKATNIGNIIKPGIGRVLGGMVGRGPSIKDYIDDPSLFDDNGELISLSKMTPDQKAEYKAARREFNLHNLMNSKIEPGMIKYYNPIRGEFDDSLREKRKNATFPITPEALNAPIITGLKPNKTLVDSGIKPEKIKIPKITLK